MFKFTRISDIERRILEIKKTLSDKKREKEMASEIPMPAFEKKLEIANRPLLEELDQLETERKFLLDERDSLFWRIIWNVVVPIIVSLITASIVTRL